MIRPIDAATLGLVSSISRTVLAIAALGLLAPESEPESNGGAGESGRTVDPYFNAFLMPRPPLSVWDTEAGRVAYLAVGAGMVC